MASDTPQNEAIPTYRIDLSLPPSERYKSIATDFAPKMRAITPIMDELLSVYIPWRPLRYFIEFLASITLWRVYSSEETSELKGISRASGVPLYFFIALNVILDSLMGCTSGGVIVKGSKQSKGREVGGRGDEGMMHFRTLDWGMDGLRNVLVVLEFVRSESDDAEKVIARTVTYCGFVGVLTGVRKNLSMSLNFRPNHECSTLSLRWHQILVLFGFKPSIASLIRSALLPDDVPPLNDLTANIAGQRTSPCYLILSDGTMTTVIEKDLLESNIRTSSSFIVHTNHDNDHIPSLDPGGKSHATWMDCWVEESEQRRNCIQRKWDGLKRRHERKQADGKAGEDELPMVREKTLKGWVKAFPIMNECSHFACIMAPRTGTIRFLERGATEEEG